MEFSIKSGSPDKQRTACVVVGVFEPRKLTLDAELIDKSSNGVLTELLRHGDMEGKAGSTVILHKVPGILAERVLLVGLGKKEDFHEKEYRSAIGCTVKALNETGAFDGTVFLTEVPVDDHPVKWRVRQAAMVAKESLYRFDQFKSKKDEVRRPLRKLTFVVDGRGDLPAAEQALKEGLAIGEGVVMARNLGDLPPNVCTPTYLAEQGLRMGRELGLDVEVLDRADMEKLGMHSLLSVTRGSKEPPKLIVAHYRGGKAAAKPVVLVGKGITFDSGGISLKPGEGMDEMKYDMCGAAAVLGTLRTCATLKLPINLTVLVPCSENMPSGTASRPGDIVMSMSGQTIEILNTDAEGRLILCDALTYAERFDPAVVIDVATLTGACVIALGHVVSGLFCNSDALARSMVDAGQSAWDRVWPMPLWDDYQEQLKSNFADMANIGGRPGGSVTAACFLSRFTKKYDWAHIDIAGTAWKSAGEKGATGRPVPLLAHYLIAYAASK